MKRIYRIGIALLAALGVTGLYISGPDPEVCDQGCHWTYSPSWAWVIFAFTTLATLRILKKIDDINRRYK